MIDIGKNDASVCNRKLIHKTKGKEWPELLTVVSRLRHKTVHSATQAPNLKRDNLTHLSCSLRDVEFCDSSLIS